MIMLVVERISLPKGVVTVERGFFLQPFLFSYSCALRRSPCVFVLWKTVCKVVNAGPLVLVSRRGLDHCRSFVCSAGKLPHNRLVGDCNFVHHLTNT